MEEIMTNKKKQPTKDGKARKRIYYSDEIADKICEQITAGKSLNQVSKLEGFPARGTIQKWLVAHEYFRSKAAEARQASEIALFDEIRDIGETDLTQIAEDVNSKDLIPTLKNSLFNQKCHQLHNQICDLKWRLKILNPKKYGDRVQSDVNFNSTVNQMDSKKLEEEALAISEKILKDKKIVNINNKK